jgi:CheY-like chemotaxis protein
VNRRILLIDADPAFRASLARQLERYRFDITAEPDPEQAIALGTATLPALLVVSVEEPDKAGFKVFQRCKRGALAKVPIVLVTSSVPPESFAKHRGLKVHADEYIDKRSISDDELLGKIDHLVGLGELADDDLGMSLEIDEIPLSSDDMVLEETVGEDDADAGGEPRVDSMVDAETDAAFAALLGDDAPAAPAAEPPAAEPLDAPEPLPQQIDTSRMSDGAPSVVIAAVPAAIAGRPQDSGGVQFDSFSRESMRPPVDLIARARQDHRDRAAHLVGTQESGSAIPIDVDDLEPLEYEAPSAHAPEPEPEPEATRPRFVGTSTGVEARSHAAAAALHTPATGHHSSSVPDLGLDAIAATETATEHSGVFDRRALRKLGELERQIAQLKTELDRARATADASARGVNREREFLNLREQIIAKDKDLHRAKDDRRARDRELADAQDRLHEAEQARAELEVRATELEQRAAADAYRAAALEVRDKAYANQLAALHQELEARTHAATTAESARLQLDRDLAGERALRAASASDAERSLRVDREQLVARHQAELTAVRNEAAATLAAALEALREELEGDHATAVAVATESTRAALASHAERAVGELEAKHARVLARLAGEHGEAIAQLTDERDAAMERVASEREAAVAAAEDEHHELIARLQTERVAELSQAREAATIQLAHARDELIAELAYVRQEAETRIAATTAARDRAVAELDRVKHQLAQARAEHEATLDAAAASHEAALDEQASLHAEDLARREQDHAAARAEAAAVHSEALAASAALRAELERQTSHHGGTLEAARQEIDDLIEQHEHAKGALIEQHRRMTDELAQVHDDKQRAVEELQHAVAEARAAEARAAAQHRAELIDTRRAMEEATARWEAEREVAERAAAKALDEQKALHERALAIAHGEVLRTKAVADAEHGKAIAVLQAEHERQRNEAHAEHAKLVGELTAERDELRRGLSSARDGSKRSDTELASAVQMIADRTAELHTHAAAITERDQRIADLRHELEALEQENASYQEQVLRAYQKIKADEAMVSRAKKAMAIALTVLDDPANPKSEPT